MLAKCKIRLEGNKLVNESKNKNSGWPKQPSWFEKGSDIINVYEGLLRTGMKEENVFKILGSNWLNFIKNSFG